MWAAVRTAALCVALVPGGSWAAPTRAATPFHFEIRTGQNLDCFLREGQSAAHLVLRGGLAPRILVAFPAGDSGVALWFDKQSTPLKWTVDVLPQAKTARDSLGRPLNGIVFEVATTARTLVPRQAVLSSVRVLRDYQDSGAAPAAILVAPVLSADTVTWSRGRLDGAPGYRLALTVIQGALKSGGVISAANGQIRLRITALTGDTPLTPLSGAGLLNGSEGRDQTGKNVLTFLSYREKFLAGSWRFDTYFGRDTLMSLRLLMPVLAPEAIEAGLRSVLTRLAPDGEVAHEESIGEFAVLSHLQQGSRSDAPLFDYGMIDGTYLLAPVIAAYLLDQPEGRGRAASYLRAQVGGSGTGGTPTGVALAHNLLFVARTARSFAADPGYQRLMALKPGHTTGEWRDSNDGLGGGRYPYDVNAVLVPAALDAAAHLLASRLLDPYLSPADRAVLAHAAADNEVWRRQAPSLFAVSIDNARARAAVTSYARQIGVPAGQALRSLDTHAVHFHALSLDAAGTPIPIVNSDTGFELLFSTPAPADLDRDVESVLRPFPLGLLTDVGMVVADPVFTDAAIQARFTNHAYHGTVIWSWQQALFASGLQRQLKRTDLPDAVRADLLGAQQALWQAIRASRSVQSSELWSWRFEGGAYRIAPFGASGLDVDEANAAQLWSTVYLALKGPSAVPR
ncbi:MAG TPA: hypothetical protein VGV09_01490 [Steroidobacteraceae bacterium]|nr:hypothetical protein [Steroidobacteraceae bacterium]